MLYPAELRAHNDFSSFDASASGYYHPNYHPAARYRLQSLSDEMKCPTCDQLHMNPKFCCHIRAISEFPADATVAEVNADENILVLCPNCHWEFDRGMLDISEISLIPDPQSLLF